MKKQILAFIAIIAISVGCEKEQPVEKQSSSVEVNDNDTEEVQLRSSESTTYAYVTSIGMVVLINDLSEIELIERDISQMSQEEIEIELAKLKYKSESCTTADGKRGLKCTATKKGDCKSGFDCTQAADGGDY